MQIYTMGFAQKSAETFFELVKKNEIEILIDVRLNNQSQLAGFTKGRDLQYFLKELTGCEYAHDLVFAPTRELLDDYKKGRASWDDYVKVFTGFIEQRRMSSHFASKYGEFGRVLLLCSEPTPEKCHRRLVAEAVAKEIGAEIVHL